MRKQYDCIDFNNMETWRILYNEVAPALEKAARIEFETTVGGDFDKCTAKEIREQAEMIKQFLCSYVDGLEKLHCIHGAGFYGDPSAENVLQTPTRRCPGKFRNRSIKDITKALKKLFPKCVIMNRH